MSARKNNETVLTPRQFRFLLAIEQSERCSGAIHEAVEEVSGELSRQHFYQLCMSLLGRGLVSKRCGVVNRMVFYSITEAGLSCLRTYQIKNLTENRT